MRQASLAQASLAQAAESRHAIAHATKRSFWLDLGRAASVGGFVTLTLSGHGIAGVVVLLVGTAAVSIAQAMLVRRRGAILDSGAIGSRAWRFALLYLVVVLLVMIEPPAGWLPWFAVGVGTLAGVGGFAWLRWEAHYQTHRLARGDYDRQDRR